jgi:hypothetical protein
MLEPKVPAAVGTNPSANELSIVGGLAAAVAHQLSKGRKKEGVAKDTDRASTSATATPTPPPAFAYPPYEREHMATPTPTANEIRRKIALADARAERERKRQEDRAFQEDPLGFLLSQAGPYYNEILATKYGTTIQDLVSPPFPKDSPLGDNEIMPGLEPIAATNRNDATNTFFLDALELDSRRYANYDPVYLEELKAVYPEQYQRAMDAAKDEVVGPIAKSVFGPKFGEILELLRKLGGGARE